MSAIAIIPARGGSRRIQKKNMRTFYDRPIIEYPIETALRSGLFTNGVWVSTDDIQIAGVAHRAGAMVHLRNADACRDEVGTQEVMRIVLEELVKNVEARPEHACCIYPCTPLINADDLRSSLAVLGALNTHYIYATDSHRRDAGAFYWGTVDAFLQSVPLQFGATYELPDERICDINTESDWLRAYRLYDEMTQGKEP